MATSLDYGTAESLRRDFRAAMRHVAAPVCVVTTLVDGVPYGATVSAFGSLSMDPPLMTLALRTTSRLFSVIELGARLGVNTLASTQADRATHFAGPCVDRFAGLDWATVDGAPRLADAHAWIAIEARSLLPLGDHVVVVGTVIRAERGVGLPLTFHDGTFGTHTTVGRSRPPLS